jgi:hypothetical protein
MSCSVIESISRFVLQPGRGAYYGHMLVNLFNPLVDTDVSAAKPGAGVR